MSHNSQKLTTTQRGYGREHRRLREALLPLAYGQECPLCGRAMLRGQRLDLHHVVQLAYGGGGPSRMAHARCNRQDGARIGTTSRWGARRAAKQWNSRVW